MSRRDPLTVRAVQVAAWDNKLRKGFNVSDVPLEFCYLQKEMSEAFEAWLRGRPDLGEELADVVLFAAGLAQIVGVDLEAEVAAKIRKNVAREYVAGPNGYMVRREPGDVPA
jgi:hypothetical protein